ncbi:MAG TPA: hypothetical protein VN088_19065 [Nocardioides sp.]|nr:hypothetical protein [Nocardioides sp.]
MTSPAVAPYVPSYATETPYITVDDFLAEPTGVDVTQLVTDGSEADNRAALARLIARASSQADDICRKKIAATVDVQAGSFRRREDGTIWVPVDYAPIVQVNAVELGLYAGATTAMGDLSGLDVGTKLVKIPVWGLGFGAGFAAARRAPAGPGSVYAKVTYVNGFAVTTTAAASAAGDSQLLVRSALGVAPGLSVTVSDGASTESIVVGDEYVSGSLTVPTAMPLLYAHTADVAVSALPGAIKDAVILLTTSRIKLRGAEAVQMGSISAEPSSPTPTMPGGATELAQAKDLLLPFRRAR